MRSYITNCAVLIVLIRGEMYIFISKKGGAYTFLYVNSRGVLQLAYSLGKMGKFSTGCVRDDDLSKSFRVHTQLAWNSHDERFPGF